MNKTNRIFDSTVVRYMRDVRKYPLLEAKTEVDLARRWRDCRDPKAAEKLVGSHQRLVVKIALEYRGYGLPLSDLISEGNVGLMQAISKFDPERGFRLSTYAMWWIRAQISDYILKSSSIVKMATNEHQKRLFFNLRRLKAKHQGLAEGQLSPTAVTAIAKELGVPESEIVLMDRRLAQPDISINTPAGIAGESDLEWQDFLVDQRPDQEDTVLHDDEREKRRALMQQALAELDERERRILVERKLRDNPSKLSELSKEYGVSRERVRQLEARALAKIEKAIRKAAMVHGVQSQFKRNLGGTLARSR